MVSDHLKVTLGSLKCAENSGLSITTSIDIETVEKTG